MESNGPLGHFASYTRRDYVYVLVAAAFDLGILLFPLRLVPLYRQMYADFGQSLPGRVELCTSTWFSLLICLIPLLLLAVALASRLAPTARRRLILISALAALALFIGLCLVASSVTVQNQLLAT